MQHLEERRCKWSHVKVNWEEQQRMNCFTSSRKEPSFSFWHNFGDIHKLIDLFISKLNNWFFSIVNVRDIFFICIQLFFHQIILTLILVKYQKPGSPLATRIYFVNSSHRLWKKSAVRNLCLFVFLFIWSERLLLRLCNILLHLFFHLQSSFTISKYLLTAKQASCIS